MSENGTDVWGPPLWRTMHSLAERLGKQTNTTMVNDEKRAWVNFLKSVDTVIPCPKCRHHYKVWSHRNKIDNFITCPYGKFREEARKWLWALHTEINDERKVMGVLYSEVEQMYSRRTSADIHNDNKEFTTVMVRICSFMPFLKQPLHVYQICILKLRLLTG